MPKRSDLRKILIIGAGPIIVGQACEFDYSGTQACKALKEEGFEIVLVNSNPATIMTDPELADATYIEPITAECVTKIIEKERPDALLPTMGGQTSLNVAVELAEAGVLDKYKVELIGAKLEAIKLAEDRQLFKDLMNKLELGTPKSATVSNLAEAHLIAKEIGFPLILRPAFTLGGYGGGVVYNFDELDSMVAKGLAASPNSQVLVEQSLLGWKEIEYEVMRDLNDNVVIICAIENFDPMGVHTGDSITVAPTQTLTDKEFQMLRDASLKVIRGVGVETGGSNIQFAINPNNSDFIVIEMNPRVSRSSALASKATGFPIAKIAAKLAVGYTLDEIPNDITKKTMASFEPALDYVVTKIPKFAFEKFPGVPDKLNTQMKSVGETMSVARSFKESFQKALRSIEKKDSYGFINPGILDLTADSDEAKQHLKNIKAALAIPSSKRVYQLFDAFYLGLSLNKIHTLTRIDKWFLTHLEQLVAISKDIQSIGSLDEIDAEKMFELKKLGFSDRQLSILVGSVAKKTVSELEVFNKRHEYKIKPVFKTIDTCAGEFESFTPYHYSSYEEETEITKFDGQAVFIIGGGPNRIGQGIEFDYCCVHASMALQDLGFKTIMINNNPETVSTDFDSSDKLYFEPITVEDVMAIYEAEKAAGNEILGAIVQFGGQTPLNIATELKKRGLPILGTQPEQIDLAEDRDQFGSILAKMPDLKQTANAFASSQAETLKLARELGYPVVLRPSYVLGGRGMEIIYSDAELELWFKHVLIEDNQFPVLIDKFLDNAIEVDVDALCDTKEVYIAGVMEHIEYAGIHSGDSASVYPAQTLDPKIIETITRATEKLALMVGVRGLLNIQFAVKNDDVYVLELNPRASRTVPFISKARHLPFAKYASQIMLGKSIAELKLPVEEVNSKQISVKEAVFSFNKFDETPIFLGPEMKSTGEVMGISENFHEAFVKAQLAAGLKLPNSGKVFLSFNDDDKQHSLEIAKNLQEIGFSLVATAGTADYLEKNSIELERVYKVNEARPTIVDFLKNGEITLIYNVPSGKYAYADSQTISKIALSSNIPVVTTVSAAKVLTHALAVLKDRSLEVKSIQEYNLPKMPVS
jgi:carbamoyl-phosphate synthase large subunit